MKKLILTLAFLLVATVANAATWCEWNGSFPENCIRDNGGVIAVNGQLRSGGAPNFNSLGFYELVTMPNPALQDGNMFTDWTFAFTGSEIQRTRNQGVNPNAPTAKDLKVQKAYQLKNQMDEIVDGVCTIGDYILSDENEKDIIEAIATNRDRKYVVFNHVTGYHEILTRTAAQAATLYSQCIAAEDSAIDRMDTLITDISACTGTVQEVSECLALIQWVEAEPSTQP